MNNMKLQTRVVHSQEKFDISHRSSIVLLGSCFSENIGSKLVENKFSVNVNPFGILYNPTSISNGINRLLDKAEFKPTDFISHNELSHSFMHHGSFSRLSLDDAVENVNQKFRAASQQLDSVDYLLITFGTSYVFKWNKTGDVVGNCHKLPAREFIRERLTVEDITCHWTSLIERLTKLHPSMKIIFTVSPIRHFKDGAHDNQLSKSILHLSIDSLMKQFPDNTFYFPAYEIMLDELRDYRFYAEDMIHPSNLAQDYIWNRFAETYFTQTTQKINAEWGKIQQSLAHRPINSHSSTYLKFLQRTFDDIEAFEKKYIFISCFNEKQHLTKLIKKIQ